MLSNVIGRVKNTPLPRTHSLLPLFEAIINSIDSIEEAGLPVQNGQIQIFILRTPGLFNPNHFEPEQNYRNPICGFKIIDNGQGFTDSCYQAFNEADSMKKLSKGGKGVGRFIWLKAFRKVLIQSIFTENGQAYNRSFVFSLETIDGIQNHNKNILEGEPVCETSVTLDGFLDLYEKESPKNAITIGQRIVEHCLSYFLLGKMPSVMLHDAEEDCHIDLWNTYVSLIKTENTYDFSVGDLKFKQIHFLLHSIGDLKHHVSYCANDRVVKSSNVGQKVPNLPQSLSIESESFIYAGYVFSDYLDNRVNQQRTDFDFLPDGGIEIPGEIRFSQIEQSVIKNVNLFLSSYTEEAKTKKEQFVNTYVDEVAPQYRHILRNHPERLDIIPLDISETALDNHLYQISRDIEQELKVEAQQLLNQEVIPQDEKSADSYLELFAKWWQEYNDLGKANLAKYILHRRVILHLLEKALAIQDSGKYSREEAIHKIMFPLRATSDDISYDDHNLWIIDEKLAYHHFLASDIQLRKNDLLDTGSILRPDLLFFFNNSIAVVDEEPPYLSGIVIFEFKRPMRDDYSDEENPIPQVFNYVKEIKAGKAKTKDGRPFNIPPSTPFYCYIVSDLTESLKEQAEFYSLRSTPDNSGYIGFNPNLGAYVEIISFDKLIGDAKKRNRILFDKLRISE
ncbi:MAG: hypothetical protein GYA55_07610 [SAR324 cluster bacterium]|uniref:ATP-binding protein n=1 Tax=SAR324 cluster bacterium TaxID=2024889 RepID=A0A7X9FRL1_9DELT|nr:hypothetical protein [SAR324 cluster bacterium]